MKLGQDAIEQATAETVRTSVVELASHSVDRHHVARSSLRMRQERGCCGHDELKGKQLGPGQRNGDSAVPAIPNHSVTAMCPCCTRLDMGDGVWLRGAELTALAPSERFGHLSHALQERSHRILWKEFVVFLSQLRLSLDCSRFFLPWTGHR